jgi:hypothetical protein
VKPCVPVEFVAVCPHGRLVPWVARQVAFPAGTSYTVTACEPQCSCPVGAEGEAA